MVRFVGANIYFMVRESTFFFVRDNDLIHWFGVPPDNELLPTKFNYSLGN